MSAQMNDPASVPIGKLQSVQRDWDYQAGWVRAPLREIIFNDRLTKQARLVWLWLASVPPGQPHVSWGECEIMLRCGTKARRNCMAQLSQEGYITVLDDGIVIMHSPYEVFDAKRKEILSEIREEWQDSVSFAGDMQNSRNSKAVLIAERNIDRQLDKMRQEVVEQPLLKPTAKEKEAMKEDIVLTAWNACKPESYSSMRTISAKQRECISKHMKNLNLRKEETREFICGVCNGLTKSQFWSCTVAQYGRNFNAVFGYGSPQDGKMKNIEALYNAGFEDMPTIKETIKKEYNVEQQEVVDAYKFITMNLLGARNKEHASEIQRWSDLSEEAKAELIELKVDIEQI